jgi:hypothetical protein
VRTTRLSLVIFHLKLIQYLSSDRMCLTPIQHDGQSDRLTPQGYADAALSIRKEMSGTILITGGLGFLGSVVLESLLRNCAQVLRLPVPHVDGTLSVSSVRSMHISDFK